MIRRENWLLTEKYLKAGIKDENPHISDVSIERYEFALRHLLIWADELSFEDALNTKSPSFTNHVANLPARRGEGHLSLEAQKKIILVSKKFLDWAKGNGERGTKKIELRKMKGLVHPKVTKSMGDPISVDLDEVLRLASFNFGESILDMRDIAALCFVYLSGARRNAVETAPIRAIEIETMCFYQYPSWGVHTKNGKSEQTFLLPIPALVDVIKRWDSFVRNNLPDTAPWFYPFENHWGNYTLANSIGDRASSTALIDRFESLYEKAGMKELYKSPHKYRHGHAVYSLSRCKTMADYQAVSRNLMHSSLAITDGIYADNERKERQSVISSFLPEFHPVIEGDLRNYLMSLSRDNQKEAMKILVNEVIQ